MEESIYGVLEKASKELRKGKRVTTLRMLQRNLSNQLAYSKNKNEFLDGLINKCLVDDILTSTVEDDYIKNQFVDSTIDAFRKSLETLVSKPSAWMDSLKDFAEKYRNLINKSKRYETIFLDPFNLISLVGREGENLRMGNEYDFPVFLNLDVNVCNPKYSNRVQNFYKELIKKAQHYQIKKEGKNFNSICLIEKSYSSTGTILLTSFLVNTFNLPVTIYRPHAWMPNGKIAGEEPLPGWHVCLVYDLLIGGSSLSDASDFLKQTYRAESKAAIVLLEYSKEGRKSLEEKNIEVYSLIKYDDYKNQILAKVSFVESLWKLRKTTLKRSLNEDVKILERITKKHLKKLKEAPTK